MSPIQVQEAKEQKTKNCPVRLTSMIKSREEFNSVYTLPNVEKEKSGGAASTRKSKCSKMEQLLKDGGYGEFIRKTTCCSLLPKTSSEAVAKINAMSEDLSVIYIWMARFMNWRFTRTTTQDGVMTSEYDNFQSGVAKGVATPPTGPSDIDDGVVLFPKPDPYIATFIDQHVSAVIGRPKAQPALLKDFKDFLEKCGTTRKKLGIKTLDCDPVLSLRGDYMTALQKSLYGAKGESFEKSSGVWGRFISLMKRLARQEMGDPADDSDTDSDSDADAMDEGDMNKIPVNESSSGPDDTDTKTDKVEKANKAKYAKKAKHTRAVRNVALSVFDVITYTQRKEVSEGGGGADLSARAAAEEDLWRKVPQTMNVAMCLLRDCRGFNERMEPASDKGTVVKLVKNVETREVEATVNSIDENGKSVQYSMVIPSTQLQLEGKGATKTDVDILKKIIYFKAKRGSKDLVTFSMVTLTKPRPQGLVAVLNGNLSDTIMVKARISRYLEESRDKVINSSTKETGFKSYTEVVSMMQETNEAKATENTNEEKETKAKKAKLKKFWDHMITLGWGAKSGIRPMKPVPLKTNTINFIPITATTAPFIFRGVKDVSIDDIETATDDIETATKAQEVEVVPNSSVSVPSPSTGKKYRYLPWVPYGFSSNGRELRICLMAPTEGPLPPGYNHRSPTPGTAELTKAGYVLPEPLAFGDIGICKELKRVDTGTRRNPIGGGSRSPVVVNTTTGRTHTGRGEKRKSPVPEYEYTCTENKGGGLSSYEGRKGCVDDDDHPHSVVDFGQKNPVSFGTNNTNENRIHLLSSKWVDEHSGIIRSQEFDKCYRSTNKPYRDALTDMAKTTHKTGSYGEFTKYCQVQAKHTDAMRDYRGDPGVLKFKIRRREDRQRTSGQIARLVAMKSSARIEKAVENDGAFRFDDLDDLVERANQFVTTVFLGDGALNLRGKGHRGYSKKGVMRDVCCKIFPGGKRVQAVVFDEWGTSSRCPCGRSFARMKSHTGKDGDDNDSRGGRKNMRGGREGETDESQPCNGNLSESGTTSTTETKKINNNNKNTNTNTEALMRDTRIEVCSECETQWPHDVVSVVNMLQISARLITGEDRPAWLDRKSVVYNKGSGVKVDSVSKHHLKLIFMPIAYEQYEQ